MHSIQRPILFLSALLLVFGSGSTFCFADETPGCSASSTADGRTVNASAVKTCSITSQSGKWTVKVDGKQLDLDKSKLTWGGDQSKDLPADWKLAHVSHLNGKTSITIDGVAFLEIKDEQ